MAARRGVK